MDESARAHGRLDGVAGSWLAGGIDAAGIVKDATLKVYSGAPHGMCSTHKDQVNTDLLAFIKGEMAATV
jgi:hypothetical protein